MTEETRGGRSFDELAKGLASGEVSRGKALRLMGAALVGGALASIPRAAVAVAACKGPSACCNCDLADPNTFQVVRKKCFLMSTTGCSTEEQEALRQECDALCHRFQEQKYPTLNVVGITQNCVTSSIELNTFCQKSTTPGVRGTECGFKDCTLRA